MNKMHFKRLITNATENSEDPIIFPETLKIIKDKFYYISDYEGPCVIKPINGGSSVDVTIIKKVKWNLLKKIKIIMN